MGLPPAITANLNAIKAGKAAPYIVNKPFFDSFVNLGGTGATLGLIIAIWLVGRKNKQYSIVGNLSAAPGVFNINEPLTFGLQSYWTQFYSSHILPHQWWSLQLHTLQLAPG